MAMVLERPVLCYTLFYFIVFDFMVLLLTDTPMIPNTDKTIGRLLNVTFLASAIEHCFESVEFYSTS